jgi:dTDP-4-amino-4,6-dideoxygalactose transaminase
VTIRVPFVDLAAEHAPLRGLIDDAIRRVVDSSRFVLGPEVERFERDAASFLGAPHAIGVSSGSDALVMSLTAIGVGAGDEVLTTPFSFFATAESILRIGARPRFVDVSLDSLCLDPERVAGAISPRTRAILHVHLFGSMEGIEVLAQLSERRGVPMIEDAAQAFGSVRGGRAAGTWGAAGCFSFFPTKVLGALGDGGLVVTRDGSIAERCRGLRQHGRVETDYSDVGGNFRLDALQAAVLGVKVAGLRERIARRREHGKAYDDAFARLPGLALVKREEDWNGAIYTLRVLDGRRDVVRSRIRAAGIETAIYYPRPLHLEPALAHGGFEPGLLPNSDRAAKEVLSLPVFPTMTNEQRDCVIDAVRLACR